jgi:cytochrome c oxidase subunit 2
MSQADYERWLESSKETTVALAEQGKQLFTQYHCSGCHGKDSSVQAPRLEGVYGKTVPIQNGDEVSFVKADDRYIRDSILLPKQQVVAGFKPIMPSYQGQINEEDLLKILHYIKSIGGEEAR